MTCSVFGVVAQDAEYDDMYFNSKDRAKLVATRDEYTPKTESKRMQREAVSDDVNPTDSYSARSVNPEFTSRSNSESAQADNEDYFVNNYKLQTQSDLNTFNKNYNNWYNDPWYSSAYFGAGMNQWNSPYYGSYYSPYSSPWYDPYYTNGWSSSFSFYYGNNWNYGWGMNTGYGYGYCPNNYWNNSWYSPAYASWYRPYGSYYGYGAPTVVVVENGRGPVYGKRGSRGSYQSVSDRRTNMGSASRTEISKNRNSGRQQAYYENTWQNESRQSGSNSSQNGRISSTSTRTQDSNTNNSGWRQSSGSNNNSSYSPSRSSGSYSPSRSSGSTSGGSSGSRPSSRGRGGH